MPLMMLDGRALAAQRAPSIRERATAVAQRRGRAPVLLLMGFADERGRVPHVEGKIRACAEGGVEAHLVVIPPATGELDAADRLRQETDTIRPDAVFVQIPYPAGMDGSALEAAIQPQLDVDVMSPVRVKRYLSGADEAPPLTVHAALLLLDRAELSLRGRRGVIVAEPSPFSAMFVEALRRRGAALAAVEPDAPDLPARARAADLVIAAGGRPGLLHSSELAPGCIALDIGYFNPGGRGDIDLSGGTVHLGALMPVPGGVGPMTVSALLERVVEFAGG